MNFKEFEKILNLIGYYKHGNSEIINELLALEELDLLFDSFAKELNFNLLEKDLFDSKQNVIRYYLTELRQLQNFFKDFGDIGNELRVYKDLAHTIYITIYNEIQLTCITNQIDFFNLCDEIKILFSSFDSAITLIYSEAKQTPQPVKTKADTFKENLEKIGFYNLDKVQKLSENGQNKLIDLACKNMSYGIAMLDYLGFCLFLDEENNNVKHKTNIILTRLYNKKAKDGTQARHYRNSLIKNKPRYTSYLHKETVIKDYEELK